MHFFDKLSGNKRFNPDKISHCEFEFPMLRKPVGGVAQARIAEHLSAGVTTSSRHLRHLSTESKKMSGRTAYDRTKCIFLILVDSIIEIITEKG